MVKVNLLKPGSQGGAKAIVHKFSAGKLSKILFICSFVIFLASIILMSFTRMLRKDLSQISTEFQQAEKVKQEIISLSAERERLERVISFLSGFLKREISWSPKLTELSGLIPQDAWLTKLSFDNKVARRGSNYFSLTGGLIKNTKITPIGILSSFINKIKEDKEFSADFETPVLADLHSQLKDNTEVMVFTIDLPLRREKGSPLDETAR